MIEIPLCIYFGFKINELAKRKGKKAAFWIVIAIVSFFAAYMVGMGILLGMFYKGPAQPNDIIVFFQNPLRFVFVIFSGFGGYLLVRRTLEKMPDIEKPEEE